MWRTASLYSRSVKTAKNEADLVFYVLVEQYMQHEKICYCYKNTSLIYEFIIVAQLMQPDYCNSENLLPVCGGRQCTQEIHQES
jgi:hypothetical protein